MHDKTAVECYAPIFKEHSLPEAVGLSIVYYLLIAVMLPFYWVPSVLCLIKRFHFFIRYCLRGNENPNIPL